MTIENATLNCSDAMELIPLCISDRSAVIEGAAHQCVLHNEKLRLWPQVLQLYHYGVSQGDLCVFPCYTSATAAEASDPELYLRLWLVFRTIVAPVGPVIGTASPAKLRCRFFTWAPRVSRGSRGGTVPTGGLQTRVRYHYTNRL